MKLPKDLFTEKELEAIRNVKIEIDFDKDYTDYEIGDLEFELKQACLDYGFTKCQPNENCAMWERICDHFIEVTDELLD